MRTKESIHNVVESQREYFKSGQTLDVNFRIRQLETLRSAIKAFEDEIKEALYEDLGRSESEAYLLDIGTVILELNETIHGLKKWAKPEILFSGLQ